MASLLGFIILVFDLSVHCHGHQCKHNNLENNRWECGESKDLFLGVSCDCEQYIINKLKMTNAAILFAMRQIIVESIVAVVIHTVVIHEKLSRLLHLRQQYLHQNLPQLNRRYLHRIYPPRRQRHYHQMLIRHLTVLKVVKFRQCHTVF